MSPIPLRNPRTGACEGAIEGESRAAVAAEASRLRAAQPAWLRAGLDARIRALAAWAADVASDTPLLDALVADTGRLHVSKMELAAAEALVARWAAVARNVPDEGVRPTAVVHVTVRQQDVPYALAGVIAPWNSPLGLSLIDSIPALIAGCAALVKPSEITPRFIAPLRRITTRHPLVDSVLGLVAGNGSTGEAVIDAVDIVCFTGSVTTGRRVAAQAAARLVPACLELGGKDAAIVLDGADLDRAAAAILWSATVNSGQTCHSTERVYVAEGLFRPLVDRLAEGTRRLRLARPGPADGLLGPFIDGRQGPKVAAQVSEALSAGAQFVAGGPPFEDGGWWMEASVMTGVSHDMALMQEETFAPLVPVMAVAGAEAAIRLANDSRYGLSASVFGPADEALEVARHLAAGGVSINDASLPSVVQEGEKMAFGCSGLGGSRMGPAGYRRFFRRKALLSHTGGAPSPWWHG